MAREGIEALVPRPGTSKAAPGHKIYPYLLRGVSITEPNHAWAADITYVPIAHGFLYLVAVIDWASRAVLAWRLSNTMDAGFCIAALEDALLRHGKPQISARCESIVATTRIRARNSPARPSRRASPKGAPEQVRVHDLLIKQLGRAVPYGIYDLAANAGWVGVGMDNDTAAFAVNTIRRWWQEIGRMRYPNATRLVITADGGGSNNSRGRLWKVELQRLADELGLAIEVHHLPPGTSKWNKIEHKLFVFVSMNWRAKPLVSYRVIVDLIGATTTKTGLIVKCELDDAKYPKGIAISDQKMDRLNIHREAFRGEWNYSIIPTKIMR